MPRRSKLETPDVTKDILGQLLSSTPEGVLALLAVMLDRQGKINIDEVKYALDFFDENIPYPFVCTKDGINRYSEVIDLLRKGEAVVISGCKLTNIRKSLRRAGIKVDAIKLGRRYYLLIPKVVEGEQRGEQDTRGA